MKIEKEVAYKDTNNQKHSIQIKQRLILTYSSARAKKDKYNRKKALQRLKSKIEKSTNLTKNDLEMLGYAKFLKFDNEECNISFNLDVSTAELNPNLEIEKS